MNKIYSGRQFLNKLRIASSGSADLRSKALKECQNHVEQFVNGKPDKEPLFIIRKAIKPKQLKLF